jgi:hypothetical protein
LFSFIFVYIVVSFLDLQINARFVFLESSKCGADQDLCWTHPGTYLGEIGILFENHRLQLISGSLEQGMKVIFNNKTLTIGDKYEFDTLNINFEFVNKEQFSISTHEFRINFNGRDHFFNEQLNLTPMMSKLLSRPIEKMSTKFLTKQAPHGLIGQTWNKATYKVTKRKQITKFIFSIDIYC